MNGLLDNSSDHDSRLLSGLPLASNMNSSRPMQTFTPRPTGSSQPFDAPCIVTEYAVRARIQMRVVPTRS